MLSTAAVKGGLSADEALRAITVTPAKILGIDDVTGSITVGKDADLQLYRRGENPLELLSEPQLVMVNGRICRKDI